MDNDKLARIKDEVKITQYAEELGFTLVRRGRYFSLKEHDSVMIDPNRNCFWQNSGMGNNPAGSVIDFVMNFTNQDLSQAIKELSERVEVDNKPYIPVKREVKIPQEAKQLELPEKADNMKKVFAYLIKSRCIDPEIVQDFVKRKMLYQDKKGNCVFVARDDEKTPVFACFRGTNTEKRFLGDVNGCNYNQGFYINNGSKRIVVAESVIDAMSVMTIWKAQGIDYNSYNYMILAGVTKEGALLNHINKGNISELVLALDKDEAGINAAENISKQVPEKINIIYIEPEHAKDWNAELQAANKERSIDTISIKGKEAPWLQDAEVVEEKNIETLSFKLNNGVTLFMSQTESDGPIKAIKLDNSGNCIDNRTISAVEMVMLNRLYDDVKDKDIHNSYINPQGKNSLDVGIIEDIATDIDNREITDRSIYADIGDVLEKYNVHELAEYYLSNFGESSLRYFLESGIIKGEINKEKQMVEQNQAQEPKVKKNRGADMGYEVDIGR